MVIFMEGQQMPLASNVSQAFALGLSSGAEEREAPGCLKFLSRHGLEAYVLCTHPEKVRAGRPFNADQNFFNRIFTFPLN